SIGHQPIQSPCTRLWAMSVARLRLTRSLSRMPSSLLGFLRACARTKATLWMRAAKMSRCLPWATSRSSSSRSSQAC
ncbi:unnamed protein product, partial [Polarella glacialis]